MTFLGTMWMDCEHLVLELTAEEAYELFTRCLKSSDDDNEASRSVLRKLGLLLDSSQYHRAA